MEPSNAAAMALYHPMATGLSKGHKVTKNASILSHCRERLTEHTKFVWDMIWEVLGFALYKQSALGLLKVSTDKQAKFIKKWMGMHICAKRKQEELSNVLAAKMKAAATDWAPCFPLCALWDLIEKNIDMGNSKKSNLTEVLEAKKEWGQGYIMGENVTERMKGIKRNSIKPKPDKRKFTPRQIIVNGRAQRQKI